MTEHTAYKIMADDGEYSSSVSISVSTRTHWVINLVDTDHRRINAADRGLPILQLSG